MAEAVHVVRRQHPPVVVEGGGKDELRRIGEDVDRRFERGHHNPDQGEGEERQDEQHRQVPQHLREPARLRLMRIHATATSSSSTALLRCRASNLMSTVARMLMTITTSQEIAAARPSCENLNPS